MPAFGLKALHLYCIACRLLEAELLILNAEALIGGIKI
jgi:hypothetical protein